MMIQTARRRYRGSYASVTLPRKPVEDPRNWARGRGQSAAEWANEAWL